MAPVLYFQDYLGIKNRPGGGVGGWRGRAVEYVLVLFVAGDNLTLADCVTYCWPQ